jgi:hypothetical protein
LLTDPTNRTHFAILAAYLVALAIIWFRGKRQGRC